MPALNEAPNGHTEDGALNILIVGAGIGGLAAAVGLRQQGHHVKIFEQSAFPNEIGAAIHLPPNCNGLLRRYGLVPEDIGANNVEGLVEVAATGELQPVLAVEGPRAAIWQYPWQLVHRAHLHQALKKLATQESGKGKPAELFTSNRVVDVDPQKPAIKLENGDLIQGDVVLGADGVHSTIRKHVDGGDTKPFRPGKRAFGGLTSRAALEKDPLTAPMCEKTGQLYKWLNEDRTLVMYPCVNNTMMSFVAMYASNESEAPGEDWNQGGSKDLMLKVFSGFGKKGKALLSQVDVESLKVLTLYDMETLQTWVNGRLALLGDAAHPFMYHQGQGDAQAIEDGASIAVVLPFGTPKEEIPDRLKLYQQCRKERASKIQQYTRLAGRDQSEIAKAGQKLGMEEYIGYNFGHDEWDHSTQMLRKWQWAKKPDVYWRIPVGYGPANGPRQDVFGRPRDGSNSTFTTYTIKFNTSRTLLQNLLPREQFTFASPATVAQASFSCTTLGNMAWLGGGGYSHCGLYIHGIQYKKRDGSVLNGTHLSVLFESLSDPITTGREELGMPKLFCGIEPELKGSKAHIRMHWRGATFGELEWNNLSDPIKPEKTMNGGKFAMGNFAVGNGVAHGEPPNAFAVPPDEGLLAHRYVPAVGKPGTADADYACFIPLTGKSEERIVEVSQSTKTATFKFTTSQEQGFETIRHISDRLSEIPIFGIVEATVESGRGVEDVGNTVRIE